MLDLSTPAGCRRAAMLAEYEIRRAGDKPLRDAWQRRADAYRARAQFLEEGKTSESSTS